MIKIASICGALLASASIAAADVKMFAANGCDPANIVPVVSKSNPSVVLYWANINGGGCRADRGDTGAAIRAMSEAEARAREAARINAENAEEMND